MTRMSVAEVLARTNASIVGPDVDVTGVLASLLRGALEALPADAAAILVESEGSLDLLAASSHRVADLESYQAQVEEGPCLDAIALGRPVDVAGAPELTRRWPLAGPVIVRSGYTAVLASPLTWQGTTFGALNVFRTDGADLTGIRTECQALADAVTLVVVSARLGAEHLDEGLRAALAHRAVVEQAKGALAQLRSVDMPTAFTELVALAQAEGVPLGVAAERVMERARTGSTSGDDLVTPA